MTNAKSDQRGMASIVVVGILIVLLTLISIGFTRIMDRAQQVTSADQQAAAADYAAQSGINAVARYLQSHYPDGSTPSISGCDDILSTTDKDKVDPNLGSNTKITCALVDNNTAARQELDYSGLQAYGSKIVKLQAEGNRAIDQILFSWRSTDPSKNVHVNNSNLSLLNESDWASNRYSPVLRVTLYTFPNDYNLQRSQSHTFYFYPQTVGDNQVSFSSDRTANNALKGVNCSNTTVPPFAQATGYDCSVKIQNINFGEGPGKYYYARITPMYSDADVRIAAVDSSSRLVNFQGGQVIIDVTAKSGTAAKRLRARVTLNSGGSLTGNKIIPDFALRSADTICKRIVNDNGIISIDDPTGECFNTATLGVTLTANPQSITRGQSSTLTWRTSNSTFRTRCSAPWTSQTGASGSQSVSPSNTTTYTITCTDPARGNATDSATVTVVTVPPTLGIGNLGAEGFQPPNVALLATMDPNGNQLSKCWFEFSQNRNLSNSQTLTLHNTSGWTYRGKDGISYTDLCQSYRGYTSTQYISGSAYWTGISPCHKADGYGYSQQGSIGQCEKTDAGGAWPRSSGLGKSETVYFRFCAQISAGTIYCSPEYYLRMNPNGGFGRV